MKKRRWMIFVSCGHLASTNKISNWTRYIPIQSMKPRFIQLFVPCLLVLMSCGSDDPSDNNGSPAPPKEKCLLQKQISPTLILTITRNSEGLPISIDYDYKYQNVEYTTTTLAEYDGSGHLIKIKGEDYSFTYEYDSQGKVVLEKYDAIKDPIIPYSYPYERSYSYDNAGNLVKISFDENTYERYEYDSNGNLTKMFLQTITQPEYLVTEYLSYDDKKSPYLEFPFQYSVYLGSSEVYTIISSLRPVVSENNIVSVKNYLPDGTSVTQNATYAYNDLGYPTSMNESNVSFVLECK